ncbi:LacI family DNA-binding transcriptional regulator [Akkermansiaceae bacterium]|nr:LacI family DNA-binding transcriptional regulator [Akkermansiaceae bacterium]
MVTQAQIAEKLGVSRQLVTFALSGHPHVAKESRELIIATANEMGYRPNPFARALKRKRTGIVALWIPDQISTHYNHVARELGRLVKQDAQELIVSEIGGADMNQIWSNVPVDGILAVDASEEAFRELESLAGNSAPIVSIGAHASAKTDSVRVDLGAGATSALKHLIGSGYKRIAHATFVSEGDPHGNRRKAYAKAMRDAGLAPEFIQYPFSEKQRSITRSLIQGYIAENGAPEAIFCHSDDVALGIYRGLCDMGIRVPGQVALVGCDGIEDCEYLEVPLTTIVQPVAEMCATAWEYLKARIENPKRKPAYKTLLPALVIRQSSQRTS